MAPVSTANFAGRPETVVDVPVWLSSVQPGNPF